MSYETQLRREEALLVVIDIQERLLAAIPDGERLVKQCGILLDGLAVLGVPVFYTEQYPRGLGPTVPLLLPRLAAATRFEKMSFSCCGEESFLDRLEETDRNQILLCGIEAHVCVLQTALDLLENGYQVYIVADAIASRLSENREIALRRLQGEGAILTSVEIALFELLGVAGTDEFKAIAKLIR